MTLTDPSTKSLEHTLRLHLSLQDSSIRYASVFFVFVLFSQGDVLEFPYMTQASYIGSLVLISVALASYCYAKSILAPAAPPFIKVAHTLPGRAVGAALQFVDTTVRPTVLRMFWPCARAVVTSAAQRAAREGMVFGSPSAKAFSSPKMAEPVASWGPW